MKIKELGHVAFKCRNLKESVDFYCGILGLEKKFVMTYGELADAMRRRATDHGYDAPEDDINHLMQIADREWFIYLKICERQFLELFEAGEASELCIPDEKKFNYQHMALIVEDIYSARKELEERGVKIDIEVDHSVDGNLGMWIHDPDGNKIEIIQYTENSLQFK